MANLFAYDLLHCRLLLICLRDLAAVVRVGAVVEEKHALERHPGLVAQLGEVVALPAPEAPIISYHIILYYSRLYSVMLYYTILSYYTIVY